MHTGSFQVLDNINVPLSTLVYLLFGEHMYTFMLVVYQGIKLLVLGSSHLGLVLGLVLADTAKSFSKVVLPI